METGTMRGRAALVLAVLMVGAIFGVAAPQYAQACPNEGFRSGPSAQLPDCRAYELVTPPNSDGRIFGDFSPNGTQSDDFPVEPWYPTTSSLIFSTLGSPLTDPEGGTGAGNSEVSPDLYEAVREASGWKTVRHLTPDGSESLSPYQGAFSSDHKYIFTHVGPFPNIPGSPPGSFGSLYLGADATYLGDSAGHFELVGLGSVEGNEPLAQGRYISPAGAHVIFSTGKEPSGSTWCSVAVIHLQPCAVKRLAPNAPPKGTGAIYDRPADGPTQVVSLLPGNIPPGAGKNATYQGASADGTAVAFKIEEKLLVRVNNEKTEQAAPSGSAFGGLSADGTYLLYVSGGDIHRFNTVTEADEEVNSTADAEMVNVSVDGSHVYFISESQLDGSKGSLGEPNMYVWSGGSTSYIATVASSDTEGEPALTHWLLVVAPNHSNTTTKTGPGTDSSRTTPDGTVIAFQSRKRLTGYNNDGHTEIYRYDSQTGQPPECVSCNSSSSVATRDARFQNLAVAHPTTTVHNLSADGSRVFFETAESLVAADADGINDIYEWQNTPAPGPSPLALISSGASLKYPLPLEANPGPLNGLQPNSLLGISGDGADVFFLSQDALVGGAGEGGSPAIYDARIGGGFPAPAAAEPCNTVSGCRPSSSSTPALSTPSPMASGGNLKPRRCARKHRKAQRKHHSCRPHRKRR